MDRQSSNSIWSESSYEDQENNHLHSIPKSENEEDNYQSTANYVSSVDSRKEFSRNSSESTENSPVNYNPMNQRYHNDSVNLGSPNNYNNTMIEESERRKITFESEVHQRRSPRDYLPNPVHAASERRHSEYLHSHGRSPRTFNNFDDDDDQWINDDDGGEDSQDKSYHCGRSYFSEKRSLTERRCQKQQLLSSNVCSEHGLTDIHMNYTEADFKNLKDKKIFYQFIMQALALKNPLASDYKLNMLSCAKWHEFSALIPEQDSEDEPDPDLGPTQYLDLVLGPDDQDQDQIQVENNEIKDSPLESLSSEVNKWGQGSKPATLKCDMCGYTCIHYNKLKQHIMEHTGEKPYTCPNCDYKCKNKAEMKVHMCKHSGEKPFECILCEYKAQQVGSLSIHMLTHQNEEPYTCKICRMTFKTECALSRHEIVHSELQQYSCIHCDYKNPNKDDLQRHMQTHSKLDNEPLFCNYCDFKCLDISSFSKHMKTHVSDRLFKCPDCDYRCSQMDNLNTHVLIHAEEKAFRCDECPYTCRTSSGLKVHMMRHGENAPFTCTECGYKAVSNHALTNHMRTHTGERPFSCTECNYTCALKHSLKIHMGKHTQPFRCPHCSYRCAQKGSLKLHMKKHDSDLEVDSTILKPQKKVVFDGSYKRSQQIRVIPELMQIQSEQTHKLSDNTEIQIQTYRQLHMSSHTSSLQMQTRLYS